MRRSLHSVSSALFMRASRRTGAIAIAMNTINEPVVEILRRFSALALCLTLGAAHASTTDEAQPSNNFDYKRTTTFTYDSNGALSTKTTEPNRSASCSVTTFGYDPQGNVVSRQISNCPGAAGRATIASRTATSDFSAQAPRTIVIDPDAGSTAAVSFVPGVFASTTHDADPAHPSESTETDPRFGVETKHVDMNGLVTTRQLDAFGRVVRETYPDGTSRVTLYCGTPQFYGSRSGFSPNCPTPLASEYLSYVPYLVTFVHTELRDAGGAKMGPFVRSYQDELGRTVRTVTESYDGPSQAAAVAGSLVFQDTVYDKYGSKVEETKPFFAISRSSTTVGSADYGATLTTFDAKGRPVEVDTVDPNASASQSRNFPDFGLFTPQVYARTSIAYQGLAKSTTNDAGHTQVEERDAAGNVVRVTDAQGGQLALLYDAFGNLVQTTDALGNTTRSQYDYLGRRVWEQDPDKGTTQYCYDAIGQLKASQTAQMRGSQSLSACPDVADAGVTATAQSNWTTFAFDLLGHLTARVEPEMSTRWYFDKYASGASCGLGVGQECESTTNLGTDRRNLYDALGRLAQTRLDEGANNPSFGWNWTFSPATGRLATMTYPTGLQVGYDYSGDGFLRSLTLLSSATVQPLPDANGAVAAAATWNTPTVLWQPLAVGAQGTVEKELYGSGASGVTETTSIQAGTGHIVGRSATSNAGPLVGQTYAWDSVGNVRTRNDSVGDGTVVNGSFQAVTESFGYDFLNRLTSYSVSGPAINGMTRNVSLQYNAVGELLSKSDGGFYTYPAAGAANPHALQMLTDANGYLKSRYHPDLDGNVTTADTGGKYRHLSYNSFDRVSAADNSGASGTATSYSWLYDERHARVRETRVAGGNTRTIWYVNPDDEGGLSFETEFDSTMAGQSNRHYLTVGGRVIGVLVSGAALPSLGTALAPAASSVNLNRVEYWHTDHLGSLIATTDHTGAVTARYDYDPFGQRRYANGVYDASGSLVVDWSRTLNAGTARGFTRHEELDDIGLVNMNGRLFDAALGRFIQSDRYVPHELQLQSYDRYAYVMDNPLNTTDPSGFADTAGSGAAGAGGANPSPLPGPGPSILNDSSAVKAGTVLKTAELATMSEQRKFEIAKLRAYAATQMQFVHETPWWVNALDPNVPLVRIRNAQLWQAQANYLETGHLSSDDWAHLATMGIQTVGNMLTARASSGDGMTMYSPCCFVAGTPVLVEHGSLPIEKIEVGMLVQSRDETTGVTALKPVTQLIRNEGREIYSLVLLDAAGKVTRIEASDNHPFWIIGKGWLQTVELTRGMHTLGFDNKPVTVINMQTEGRTGPTYNFTVADFHTFFAGETPVLVHNASGPCNLPRKPTATTEPTLPPSKIAEGKGITVEHYYHSGDHAPPHAHILENGVTKTVIGANGNPIKGHPELTSAQRNVVQDNKSQIRAAINKIGSWMGFQGANK